MKTRVVVTERDGKIIAVYPSVSDVARCMNYTETSVRKWIAKGTLKYGNTFRYATDTEAALIRRMNVLVTRKEPDEKKEVKKEVKEKPKPKPVDLYKNEPELDGEKYTLVPYELSMGRVCATLCPYREIPKPKVGSATCMDCPSFHGRNRKKQQVACSAGKGLAWDKTVDEKS